jgi:hypothetical protein
MGKCFSAFYKSGNRTGIFQTTVEENLFNDRRKTVFSSYETGGSNRL